MGEMNAQPTFDARFRPLRPASRARLIAAALIGPAAWFAVVLVVDRVFDLYALQIGLLVAAASLVVSAAVLSVLRLGRIRQERRHADGP